MAENNKPYSAVLITGGAGYIGTKTLEVLSKEKNRPLKIISVDIQSPSDDKKIDGVTYLQEDVRSPNIRKIIKENGIEAVIHLASIVTPPKGMAREFMYSVDVEGTENVLKGCIENGVKQIIITSSGAAYGYYPDNPKWIHEDDAVRGNKEFAYSDHKRIVEEMLAEYRKTNPELKQLILRPGTIFGKDVNNQISNLFEGRVILDLKDSDSRFIFILDRDVAKIIVKGLVERKEGIYNLAGTGALDMGEIAKILHKPLIRLNPLVVQSALWLLNKFKLTVYGPEQVNFLRYRPVLSNEKLIKEFGYTPEMTSKEVFLYYVENKLKKKK